MKYLILCDVDGTLLRNNSTLSKETTSYISELAQNHYFCLVTSSSYQKTLPLYNKLNLNSYLVCKNGGLIINPKTNDKIAHVITKEDILNHFNNLKSIITSAFYKCESNAYCFNFDLRYKFIMNIPDNVFINNGDFNDLKLVDTTNLYLIIDPLYCNQLEEYFNSKTLLVDCIGKDKKRAIYVITHKLALKEKAVDFLLNNYSFDKIIGFGDTEKDINFLNKCDIPYLMCNSTLKNTKFNLTQYSNNEDGVIKELKKLGL